MISSLNFAYIPRLVCICLASFFLIHLALGLLVSAIAPAAIGRASSIGAAPAARLLLGLRLLPAAAATLVIAGVCIPSYLWLEPHASSETVGLACLAAALLGASILTISVARGLRGCRRSMLYVRRCERVGRKISLPGEPAPIWMVDGAAPLLALTGIVRARLVISQPVLRALSGGQLAAVLCHERAHLVSRDNLKRAAILWSPGLLPFFSGFDHLESAWARFTEWAADDVATDGNSRRAVTLAAALVQVARLGAAAPAPPLATALLSGKQNLSGHDPGGQDLKQRVDRLLEPAPALHHPKSRCGSALLVTGTVLACAVCMALTLWPAKLCPATLRGVHQVVEYLIH